MNLKTRLKNSLYLITFMKLKKVINMIKNLRRLLKDINIYQTN